MDRGGQDTKSPAVRLVAGRAASRGRPAPATDRITTHRILAAMAREWARRPGEGVAEAIMAADALPVTDEDLFAALTEEALRLVGKGAGRRDTLLAVIVAHFSLELLEALDDRLP